MLTRRSFLRALGIGTAAAAVPVIAEPFVRRIWAVPSNAPVGSGIERVPLYMVRETRTREELAALYGEHGYTYDPPEPITLAPVPSGYAEALRLEHERMLRISGLNSVTRGDSEPSDEVIQAAWDEAGEDMRRAGLLDGDAYETVQFRVSESRSPKQPMRPVLRPTYTLIGDDDA